METALGGPSVGVRLDKVREHATIEQLIKLVADLTATVQKLQRTVEMKDQINSILMTERKSAQVPETEIPRENFSIMESQDEIPSSQESIASTDPKLSAEIQEWISRTTPSTVKNVLPSNDIAKTENLKDQVRKKQNKNSNEDETSTDEIISSVVSQTSRQTTGTSTSLNKRNHDTSDCSNDPNNSPNLRRNKKVPKQEDIKRGKKK